MRDAFLDRVAIEPDVDITTDARPDAIEAVVAPWADAVWTQGKRFGTIGCMKDGERFELTTFRAEIYRPDSRKPEVTYSDDIVTDLSRRDFTVNAMAIALDDPELVDPFEGSTDLGARRLRTPLAPESVVRRRPACECCARRVSWRRSASRPIRWWSTPLRACASVWTS